MFIRVLCHPCLTSVGGRSGSVSLDGCLGLRSVQDARNVLPLTVQCIRRANWRSMRTLKCTCPTASLHAHLSVTSTNSSRKGWQELAWGNQSWGPTKAWRCCGAWMKVSRTWSSNGAMVGWLQQVYLKMVRVPQLVPGYALWPDTEPSLHQWFSHSSVCREMSQPEKASLTTLPIRRAWDSGNIHSDGAFERWAKRSS